MFDNPFATLGNDHQRSPNHASFPRLVLNPRGRHYQKLKETLQLFYEDGFCGEDAIYLERNSRDFEHRVQTINRNTLDICTYLESQSLEPRTNSASDPQIGDLKCKIIKKVYYPAFITPDAYEEFKLPHPNAGYGHLFSLTFTHPAAARAFFDALGCEKGPSLGTNFTLACPFVILAHYTELEWAKSYGVDPNLVRISVGLEDASTLRGWIEYALEAARQAVEDCASRV
jgi:cystathionine gamma-synthase